MGFLCGTPASLEEEGAPRVWGSFGGGLWDGWGTIIQGSLRAAGMGGGSPELLREEG